MTVNEKEFGNRMNNATDKLKIVEYINDNCFKKVLDLGAGGCAIDYMINEDTEVYCVDNQFKAELDKTHKNMHFIESGIIEFIDKYDEDFDCVILSAVLHELSNADIYRITMFLNKHLKGHCSIIIREPYYQFIENGLYALPYKSFEAMNYTIPRIVRMYPKEYKEFTDVVKKHDLGCTSITKMFVMPLCFAFTMAYGKDSWERERHEYRFTFSLNELLDFCNSVLPCGTKTVTETYDETYRTHLDNVGLGFVADAISYTNAMVIAEGDK